MESELIAQLTARVDSMEVQVIAYSLALESLLPHAPAEAKSMLFRIATSAHQIALGYEFSDRQIEQLQQALARIHESAQR